jgi:hypothetical protein
MPDPDTTLPPETFELRNLPPGAYVVQAIAAAATPVAAGEAVVRISALALQPNARMPIELSNSDINGVSLQLSAGVSITGRILVDGMPLSNMPGWENVRIPLKPTVDSSFAPTLQPAQPVAQRPTADGSFTVDGVSPGEFIVGPVTGLASGFYVKEARFNQADVLGQPLRFFTGGAGTLEIVLSSKAGSISGTTVDAAMRDAAGPRSSWFPNGSANARTFIRLRPAMRTDAFCSAAFLRETTACSAGKRWNPMRISIPSFFAAWNLKASRSTFRNPRETPSL